jgi:hypothetical protein
MNPSTGQFESCYSGAAEDANGELPASTGTFLHAMMPSNTQRHLRPSAEHPWIGNVPGIRPQYHPGKSLALILNHEGLEKDWWRFFVR